MALSRELIKLNELKEFFSSEIATEARSGFARLARIPDSHVADKLHYYGLLDEASKRAFLDCGAHRASRYYGFVVGAPRHSLTDHPFFSHWSQGPSWNRDFNDLRSVPLLRSMVQQYKIDQHNRVPSHITKEQFERASSTRSVKAPELRKRVRKALKPFGHYETDRLGGYWCMVGKMKFCVHLDFGGRSAQLRYSVARTEFKDVHPLKQFAFETALGFGFGDWDCIIEENVEDVFSMFGEAVQYSLDLPDRIRAAIK